MVSLVSTAGEAMHRPKRMQPPMATGRGFKRSCKKPPQSTPTVKPKSITAITEFAETRDQSK